MRVSLRVVVPFLLIVRVACAEDFERIRPKEPERPKAEAVIPALEKPASEQDGKVLVAALNGVRFIAKAEDVQKETGGTGIDCVSVELLNTPEFRKGVEPFLGKPVSMKSIYEMIGLTYRYYGAKDRPLVSILLPEQNITKGFVQLLVVEGKLGEVKAEGNKWFSDSQITTKTRAVKGGILRASQLQDDIAYLNQNPFRHVTPIFQPGKEPGTTDLSLKTEDRFPVRFYTGYEDSGNESTGQDRYLVGFNWGNAFMLEQELGYQFTSDIFTDRSVSHSGYWRVPLPNRHKLSFWGSYSESESADDDPLIRQPGTSWEACGRYVAPLPRFGKLQHQVQGGIDFKSYNNNLEFGGTEVFTTSTDVLQAAVEYSGSYMDKLGDLSFELSGYYSPGEMTDRNHEEDYTTSRAFTNPAYFYGRMRFERTWRLPYRMSLVNRFLGQITSQRLLSSEQLGLGGYYTVRGYDERDVNADQGFMATVELRSPDFMLGRIGKGNEFENRLQLLAFSDYGYGEVRWRRTYEKQVTELLSVGGGLRYHMGSHISARFDYGWQLENVGSVRWGDRGRIHLGVVVSY